MSVRWKADYGIEWTNQEKVKRPCPQCNWTGHEAVSTRTDVNGFLRMRTSRCTRCGCMYNTIECDMERFIDLLETEKTVEKAMKIEAALEKVVGIIGSVTEEKGE